MSVRPPFRVRRFGRTWKLGVLRGRYFWWHKIRAHFKSERNIRAAIHTLKAHRFSSTNLYMCDPATSQELVDVEALLRWKEHQKAVRTVAGATQQAFMLIGWLRSHRVERSKTQWAEAIGPDENSQF